MKLKYLGDKVLFLIAKDRAIRVDEISAIMVIRIDPDNPYVEIVTTPSSTKVGEDGRIRIPMKTYPDDFRDICEFISHRDQ